MGGECRVALGKTVRRAKRHYTERSGITQSEAELPRVRLAHGTTQSNAALPSLPLNAPLLSLAATDTREFLAEASLGAKPATFRLYKTL